MQILLVEDDELIAKGLTYSFKQNEYNLVHKTNIKDTSNFLQNEKIEFIILDISLPDGNGLDLYNNIIKKLNIPTIFLTAKDDEETIVKGLELGAEDYITKPFEKIELLARIQVQLRISSNKNKNLKYKEIELLEDNKTMKIQTNKIILTRTEYTIMKELLLNPSKVVTKTRLLDLMSIDSENCDESSLKVHISNIRKKIRKITQVEYLEAVWGIGFKIKE